MRRDNNMLKVDGNKLQAELMKRGLTNYTASVKLGFSGPYLHKTCSRGTIRSSSVTLLQAVYGITYDDIKPDPIVETCPELEPQQENHDDEMQQLLKGLASLRPDPINYEDLETAIRNGVRSGIIDILISADSRATLIEIIMNAHKQALRENLTERIRENGGKFR